MNMHRPTAFVVRDSSQSTAKCPHHWCTWNAAAPSELEVGHLLVMHLNDTHDDPDEADVA